jgi:hypothetical protein
MFPHMQAILYGSLSVQSLSTGSSEVSCCFRGTYIFEVLGELLWVPIGLDVGHSSNQIPVISLLSQPGASIYHGKQVSI